MRCAPVLAALVAAACATPPTVFEATSLRPEARGRHYARIAVIYMNDDPGLRKTFGDSVVGFLRAWTAQAERGGDLLPRSLYDADGDGKIDANVDRDLIRRRLQEAGFEAVLMASNVSEHGHSWHFEETGPEAHPAGAAEFLIETDLYDAASGKVVWSAHSRTLNPENGVLLSQSYAGAVVDELVKNDLLRKR